MTPLSYFQRAATLALLATAACSSATKSSPPVAEISPPVVTAKIPVASPEAIARAQRDSMRLPYVEADIQFMSGMIGHHAQAIDMARMAPSHGASPSVRVLASRIINAQQDEIATMQWWLADRRQPVPEAKAGPMKMKMMMDGKEMEHEMLMPGMLSEAQMKQLDAARGEEFDRLFLTFMIQHHTGATQMVKQLFATNGAGQDETVFKFASDVNVDQTTEIARMERMLEAMQLGRKSR